MRNAKPGNHLKQQQRRQLRKRLLKSAFALLQTLSRLFHLVQFVKCWQLFLELNSVRLSKFRKRKSKSCSRPPKNVKLGILRRSRAVKAKKCTVKRGARAKLCFANLNQLLFCRSRCCSRRNCLSSLLMDSSCRAVGIRERRLSSWQQRSVLTLDHSSSPCTPSTREGGGNCYFPWL